ncbi:MAG TPA: radical SAM protein [Candidatus Elarobacter sp.]|nr:radical SAM protein [Candidatus Elarobacter sp.]
MLVRPRVLSIITTRQCTAACDHCCVGASPKATTKIPVPRVHALIDEATRIPSFERVVFTGGECFLLGDDLDALVRHAAGNGFRTRVMTNGYWAVNERAAQRRTCTLRENGLDEMMLSTGTFHQRFVPVTRVIDAARAAAEVGILTRISIEECDQSAFDDTILRAEIADLVAARKVFLSRDAWITDAGGRGATDLSHERLLSGSAIDAEGSCAQVLTVITVTPDQELLSCCGFPMEQLPRLRIGTVANQSLDDVLRFAPNELMKMWLHVAGPSGIAEFVAKHIPGYTLPASPSICQSCVALQRDRRAMRVIVDHADDILQSVASAFIELHGGMEHLRAF